MGSKTLKRAFSDSLPVMAGYLALGIGFGVLLHSKGYSVIWAFAMSCTIYGGSIQYAAVDLLSSGAGLITTGIMTLIINARHIFYGLSMLGKYQKVGRIKPYLIFAMTDETYSIACTADLGDDINKNKYYFLLSLFDQCYWIIGSMLGVIISTVIKFNSAGVEFAMTALFVSIFVDQWRTAKSHIPAVLGVTITLACLIVFGSDSFVIPAMILIAFSLVLLRGKLESEADKQ